MNAELTPWLKLAALATAVAPTLSLTELVEPQFATDDYQMSNAKDAAGDTWTIVASRTPAYALGLEKQLKLLTYLKQQNLSFRTPKPEGFGRFSADMNLLVYRALEGEEPSDEIISTLAFGKEIASCLAELHKLSAATMIRCDLPAYNSNQVRKQYLDDLERVADTEFVPKVLREHWMEKLQEGPLWDFTTTFIHGSLEPHCLLSNGSTITAITDFSSAQVADPAMDLAWLSGLDHFDEILETYLEARGNADDDPHLKERCELVNELSALRWLAHGHNTSEQWIVADAQNMLAEISAKYVEAEPLVHPADAAATDALTGFSESDIPQSGYNFETEDEASDRTDAIPLFEEDATDAIEFRSDPDRLA